MKKIIRTSIVVILLIGAGFLYLNKNSQTQETSIDLTNCISYFDGCNNCTVENGRPSACTLMYCETPGEPKCNEYISEGNPDVEEPVACTMDAKECSDGSYVGRTAPDCEFAPCPGE